MNIDYAHKWSVDTFNKFIEMREHLLSDYCPDLIDYYNNLERLEDIIKEGLELSEQLESDLYREKINIDIGDEYL